MAEKPLRWGICTAGIISHDFVASLQGHGDTHLVVSIAARSLDRAKKFAENFKIPTAYGSYDELANDPDVDVVYVGTVNTEHTWVCKLFMNKKKNVLCEKPLALTLKETKEILACARENDVFFLEGMWTRFFPACAKIRELVSSGKIGEVKSMLINFGMCFPDRERNYKKALGGGTLYDMGVYLFHMVTMVLGIPTSTKTHGFLNEDGVDTIFTTVMFYPNNVMATLSASFLVDYPLDCVIAGTKGRLRIPGFFLAPTELEWTASPGGELIEFFKFPLPPSNQKYNFGPQWSGMLYEADAVREAILAGKKKHPLITWDETEKIAMVMDQAKKDLGVVYLHEEQE